MHMFRASAIVLIAIFSNFFGSFISEKLWTIVNPNYTSVFNFSTTFYKESIIESFIVFLLIYIYYKIKCIRSITLNIPDIKKVEKNFFYAVITLFVIIFSIIFIVKTNITFNIEARGVNQFIRNQSDNFERLLLLFLPISLFYYLVYKDLNSRVLLYLSWFLWLLYNISHGGRAVLTFLVILFLFEKLRNINITFYYFIKKNIKFIMICLSFFVLIFTWRIVAFGGKIENIFLLTFNSTVGALGASQILPVIKYYISIGINQFYGITICNGIISLFMPSFILYWLFGYSDLHRSSLYFNKLFNNNPDMGYDFSLMSDFYWNFGYWGYLLFIFSITFFLSKIVEYEKSQNNLKYGLAIIFTYSIVQGLRRDFGAFTKMIFYYSLVYVFLFLISKIIKISVKI